jgi:hypothetical protein
MRPKRREQRQAIHEVILPKQLACAGAVRSGTQEHMFPDQKPPVARVVRKSPLHPTLVEEADDHFGRWRSRGMLLPVESRAIKASMSS